MRTLLTKREIDESVESETVRAFWRGWPTCLERFIWGMTGKSGAEVDGPNFRPVEGAINDDGEQLYEEFWQLRRR